MLKRTLIIALLVNVLYGCSTDLDVNAPYKESTIIYGLLDKNADTNFIKINKAFLGEGDAFIYAQIPDSNEYTDAQMQAEVQRLNAQGEVAETFPLQSIRKDRAPGIFYGPQHKLYYFTSPSALDPASRYRIVAHVKGQQVESSTSVVGDLTPNQFLIGTGKLALASNTGYSNFNIRWTSGMNGKRYELSYRFNWDEVIGSDTTSHSFEEPIGSLVATNLSANQTMEVPMVGETFFQSIAAHVHDDPAVTLRIFRGVDLIWAVGGPDLHVYLQLSSPISGVVEERPQFTNITNGYGLFSSRVFREVQGKQLNDPGVGELVEGQYTGTLRFCIPGGGAPVGCP